MIYQVPLTDSTKMAELLRELEPLDAYIDVEMNSLEDAYLEIAKHEEKLVAESQVQFTRPQSNREELFQNHSKNHSLKMEQSTEDIESFTVPAS